MPIEPPPVMIAHVGVIATVLPPASLPTAVNCCVPLIATDAGFGVTVIVASAPEVTTTVAVPEMVPLVAVTVLVYVPGVVPAVNKPPLPMVPPPFATDHAGVMATTLPLASVPTAVNCCETLTLSVLGLGVTAIAARAPAVSMTVAFPVIPLLLA